MLDVEVVEALAIGARIVESRSSPGLAGAAQRALEKMPLAAGSKQPPDQQIARCCYGRLQLQKNWYQ